MTPSKEAVEAFEEIGRILLWPHDLHPLFKAKHPDYFSVLEAIQTAIDNTLDPIKTVINRYHDENRPAVAVVDEIEAMIYPEEFPLPDHIRAIGWVEAHKIKAEDTPA